jgi:agmatine/peptidylarginine deiminase
LPSYTSSQPDDISLQNKEKEVKEIFRKAFPTRNIIKVQAADLNSFSGGFHCISINEPF